MLILNSWGWPNGSTTLPNTPMHTSQRTLQQDTLTITVTFLSLQFHLIQLSSFSTYYNNPPLNCMQLTEFIHAGFSHASHNTLILRNWNWNFVPSKFLKGHTMNIVQNRARPTYLYIYRISIYISVSVYILSDMKTFYIYILY